MKTIKKICVVVASRANYGRIKYLMKAIEQTPTLQLQLIVGASTLLERFGRAVEVIKEDGFEPLRTIHYIIEGETLLTQAKSTGLGVIELSSAFDDLKPDAIVTVADRFETMATAIAATYMNIPLIHIQGGEVSGNIDDRVRHSITKLADYHFVCSEEAKERVIRMGEHVDRVYNVGCPAMDVLKYSDLQISNELMAQYNGVGDQTDWTKPYILMVQHPVTTSYGEGLQQVEKTLRALKGIEDVQKVVLWPNIDAGSEDVAKGIRMFRECGEAAGFNFFKNFSPEDYARVLNNAVVCVGNSSSFIRECAFLGVPTVIVGDRQRNREHGRNVVFCDYDIQQLEQCIKQQMAIKRFEPDYLFGVGCAGEEMAKLIADLEFNSSKQNTF